MIAPPEAGSFPAYFQQYVDLVQNKNVIQALEDGLYEVQNYFRKVTPEQGEYKYADGKWTVKEVLCHIIDTERIFNYRALCIARGEQQSLIGFDENAYADNSLCEHRTIACLLEEHEALRKSTIALYKGLHSSVLQNSGTASGKAVSIRLFPYITVGHEKHHLNIIQERYLGKLLNN